MTRIIPVVMFLVLLLPSCGSDKNVCEKAFDVQKEMCSHNKTCILCPCVFIQIQIQYRGQVMTLDT